MHREERIAAAAPFLFVLFWSSGFVAAKGGLQGAPPLTFLALRFALVTAIMLAAAHPAPLALGRAPGASSPTSRSPAS